MNSLSPPCSPRHEQNKSRSSASIIFVPSVRNALRGAVFWPMPRGVGPSSNVPAMQRTAHSSGRHLKSLRRTSSGQQSRPLRRPVLLTCCLPNLARSEGAKLASHALQVLSLPAHRQDVMKQAWTAQVTDSCAFVSRFVISGR